MPGEDVFVPNPYVMGVVFIVAAVVLWRLQPDITRRYEERSRPLLGRWSPFRLGAVRAYWNIGGRIGSLFLVGLGVTVLVHASVHA